MLAGTALGGGRRVCHGTTGVVGPGPGASGHLDAVRDDRRLSTAVAAACFRGRLAGERNPAGERTGPSPGRLPGGPAANRRPGWRPFGGEPGRRPRPPATSSVVGVESRADVADATNVRPCPLPRRKPPDRDAGRAALAEAALPFGRRESHESYGSGVT